MLSVTPHAREMSRMTSPQRHGPSTLETKSTFDDILMNIFGNEGLKVKMHDRGMVLM